MGTQLHSLLLKKRLSTTDVWTYMKNKAVSQTGQFMPQVENQLGVKHCHSSTFGQLGFKAL